MTRHFFPSARQVTAFSFNSVNFPPPILENCEILYILVHPILFNRYSLYNSLYTNYCSLDNLKGSQDFQNHAIVPLNTSDIYSCSPTLNQNSLQFDHFIGNGLFAQQNTIIALLAAFAQTINSRNWFFEYISTLFCLLMLMTSLASLYLNSDTYEFKITYTLIG